MPAYTYPAPPMYQLPLTPPEDLPGYSKDTMPVLAYSQSSYPAHVGLRRPEDRGFDYVDRFGHHQPSHQTLPPMMYPQNNSFGSAPGISSGPLPAANTYYKPAHGPILPPMRHFDQSHAPMYDVHQQHAQENRNHERKAQGAKEDKPVGGVSAKLDYDMEIMTDFVAETAHAIILQDKPMPSGFRKWVHQVLSATRLPSATILLSFDYLSIRMRKQQRTQTSFSEHELYRMLTTALILGSKFLDDNTFINRSWAEVSTIPVAVLNYMEREWLQDMIFQLHRNPNEPHGFESFRRRWLAFEAEKKQGQVNRNLRPLDTSVGPHINAVYSPLPHSAFSQPSPPPAYSAKPMQSAFPTPYTRFDNAFARMSTDTSPASAPHTGPTTPEYYGHGTWSSMNGGYGFGGRLHAPPYGSRGPQPQPLALGQPGMSFMSSGYPPPPVYASNHGPECLCITCNRRYMMAPSFGVPQPVIG